MRRFLAEGTGIIELLSRATKLERYFSPILVPNCQPSEVIGAMLVDKFEHLTIPPRDGLASQRLKINPCPLVTLQPLRTDVMNLVLLPTATHVIVLPVKLKGALLLRSVQEFTEA